MIGESRRVGDPCPKCSAPLTRRINSFYWRGARGDAAYCGPCGAIWQIVGEEVLPLPSPDGGKG